MWVILDRNNRHYQSAVFVWPVLFLLCSALGLVFSVVSIGLTCVNDRHVTACVAISVLLFFLLILSEQELEKSWVG